MAFLKSNFRQWQFFWSRAPWCQLSLIHVVLHVLLNAHSAGWSQTSWLADGCPLSPSSFLKFAHDNSHTSLRGCDWLGGIWTAGPLIQSEEPEAENFWKQWRWESLSYSQIQQHFGNTEHLPELPTFPRKRWTSCSSTGSFIQPQELLRQFSSEVIQAVFCAETTVCFELVG